MEIADRIRHAPELGSGLSVRATEEACIYLKHPLMESEQYDILSSGGNVLRAYMATCRPAWDAIPPAGDNS